jgi:hypothetical protein
MDMHKKTFSFGFIIATALFFGVPISRAAVLTVNNPSQNGKVSIKIDTQGQYVNAIEAHFSFNPQEFSIADVSDGGSIINLWVQKPTFSNDAGTLDLSGIIPGGSDEESGTVAIVSIVPKITGITRGFRVLSANVLLNDGKGTPAALSVANNPFALEPLASVSSSLSAGTVMPDPFIPVIGRDPAIFNNQYFLVFATTDQSSGIDHYEVIEASHGTDEKTLSSWQTAVSPYLLKDQALSSDIYVRAVDKAGNFRVVKIAAARTSTARRRWNAYLIAGLALLLALAVICIFFLRWRRKKT